MEDITYFNGNLGLSENSGCSYSLGDLGQASVFASIKIGIIISGTILKTEGTYLKDFVNAWCTIEGQKMVAKESM